jgi:hypothetical protein
MEVGSSEILGIELTAQEAQLRPKEVLECRQIDIQKGFFVCFNPEEAGTEVFGLLVDGHQAKVDGDAYTMGTTWNESQIGKPMPIPFNYPRYVKQGDKEQEINPYAKGTHRIQIMIGEMKGGMPLWDYFSEEFLVTITESEF